MEYYIAHSGVKEMKWGRRRYQDYNGKLTPEGREHYGVGPPRTQSNTDEHGTARVKIKREDSKGLFGSKKDKSSSIPDKSSGIDDGEKKKRSSPIEKLMEAERDAAESQAKNKEALKKKAIESGDIVYIQNHRSEFTTSELKEAIDRIKTNKEFNELIANPKKRSAVKEGGKKIVGQVLAETGSGVAKGIGKGALVIGSAGTVVAGQALVKHFLGEDEFKKHFGNGMQGDDIVRAALSNLAQKK